MKILKFPLKAKKTLEDAWQELEDAGYDLLYASEDEQGAYIYTRHKPVFSPLLNVGAPEEERLPETDWERQWQEHAPNYNQGFMDLDLTGYGKSQLSAIRLASGPGFGDLSHPTTRLSLEFLAKEITPQTTVIDIGCGSGILALAALGLGAKEAIGIDIDPAALVHAEKNAIANQLGSRCHFILPQEFVLPNPPIVVAMNMIRSEQLEAWRSLPALHQQQAVIITSGILAEEREAYLKITASWQWRLFSEKEMSGWLAFKFAQS